MGWQRQHVWGNQTLCKWLKLAKQRCQFCVVIFLVLFRNRWFWTQVDEVSNWSCSFIRLFIGLSVMSTYSNIFLISNMKVANNRNIEPYFWKIIDCKKKGEFYQFQGFSRFYFFSGTYYPLTPHRNEMYSVWKVRGNHQSSRKLGNAKESQEI